MDKIIRKNRSKQILVSLFCIMTLLSLISSSCDNSTQQADNFIFPETGTVSFQQNVKPFVRAKCATANCHNGYNTDKTPRVMWEYNDYVNSSNLGLIKSGQPDQSLLYQVVSGKNPHLSNYLITVPTANQQNGIYRWILQGAQDDLK